MFVLHNVEWNWQKLSFLLNNVTQTIRIITFIIKWELKSLPILYSNSDENGPKNLLLNNELKSLFLHYTVLFTILGIEICILI